ncbi:MAG: hypothetical protein HYX96_03745 [Chloroflexi bacterium]|nr:hypothetical protein [Chloroflexota bacterium]
MTVEKRKDDRFCPYCDEEIAEASFPYCEACGLDVLRCPKCAKVIERDDITVCPGCGAEIKC